MCASSCHQRLTAWACSSARLCKSYPWVKKKIKILFCCSCITSSDPGWHRRGPGLETLSRERFLQVVEPEYSPVPATWELRAKTTNKRRYPLQNPGEVAKEKDAPGPSPS